MMVFNKLKCIYNTHGFVGICRYLPVFAIYELWQRIKHAMNVIQYCTTMKDKCNTTLFTGNVFALPHNDAGIGVELVSGMREVNATKYLMNFLENNEVIIDIGANIGYYVVVEHYASPESEIHAIEPISTNQQLLSHNAPDGVKIYPYAFSDHSGKDMMYIPDRCNWASLHNDFTNNSSSVREEQVLTLTLDQFCVDYNIKPTFLRMDVEGHCPEIIYGAKNIIESECPLKLMIELHPAARSGDMIIEMMRYLLQQKFQIKCVILESNLSLGIGHVLEKYCYDILWSSISGNEIERLEQILRWGYCPNVFLERVSNPSKS